MDLNMGTRDYISNKITAYSPFKGFICLWLLDDDDDDDDDDDVYLTLFL
jgi:hypothetical protein